MDKLIIPFNGKTIDEVSKVDDVITAIPWDALLPTINQHVRLRPDEQIDGLICDEVNLKVKISRKRGRKVRA